jgi:hypothetical protein
MSMRTHLSHSNLPHPRQWCHTHASGAPLPTMRSSPLLPLALLISATSEVIARAGGLRASRGADPRVSLLPSVPESPGSLDARGINSILDRLLHHYFNEPTSVQSTAASSTAAPPTARLTDHPTTMYHAPTLAPTRAFSPPTASPTEVESEGYSYSFGDSYGDFEYSFSYANSASRHHSHPHPRPHEMWTETAAMEQSTSHGGAPYSFSYTYTDDATTMDDTVVTPSTAPASPTPTPTPTTTVRSPTSTPTAGVSASEQPAIPRATSAGAAHGTGTTGPGTEYLVH